MNVQKKMPNLTEKDKLRLYLVNTRMYFKSDIGFFRIQTEWVLGNIQKLIKTNGFKYY